MNDDESNGGSPDSESDVRSAGTYFLGRYRVVDEIGIGGMASVHLARMDGPGGFQKWVAIKKIHSHLVEDESFVQMFLDEARVAARISHPNVATVFDLGKHEETYWIAMEYLHGEPLREVMRRTEELGTAMPPEIACRVIADAAEGLHAAHELLGKNGEKLGLVHRDVTPHNLFVTYDGVTKVVDFGIAKFASRMSHTRAGTLKGKLAYMSPEQVHGEGIDRRTDVFALGVVLWELTTGQRLFRMESDLDTLAKVQECNVPRPSTLIRGYPVDLEKIVMKALAKNRGERFRTARELSRALQSLLMRRGLFIASDEVAAYTQSIFSDRIQKREAHLRWAAEVTQTINIDQLLKKPNISPEFTGSEQAPSSAGAPPPRGAPPGPPRPAAGMPAPPLSGREERAIGQMPPPGPQLLPDDAKETGASLTTPRAPERPAPRPPTGKSPRAPAPPPRPAAGMPADFDDAHPSDGDGPTIQGTPLLEEQYAARGLSEPPTLMAIDDADRPRPRRGVAASGGRPPPSQEPIEQFEEDMDETMVGATRDANGPFAFPPPGVNRTSAIPAPPSPPAPPRASHRSGQPNPYPTQAMAPVAPPPMQPQMPFRPPSYPGDQGFGEPMPGSNPHLGQPHHDPNMYSQQQMVQAQSHQDLMGAYAQTQQAPPQQQQQQPDFNQRGRMQPTIPRSAADNRTMTAQRFKRRPPMWVIAALSCSVALLIAGIMIAILTTTSSNGNQATRPGASAQVAAAGAATGPFTATRTAFNNVVTVAPPPPVTAPPSAPPPPPPAPTPAPTAATTPPAGAETGLAGATATLGVVAGPKGAVPPVQPTAPVNVGVQVQPPPAAPAPPKKTSATGMITVVCLPKCDSIVDNGTPLGAGHIFGKQVPAGKHVLQLSAPNGAKKTMPVDVAPDKTTEVRVSMDK